MHNNIHNNSILERIIMTDPFIGIDPGRRGAISLIQETKNDGFKLLATKSITPTKGIIGIGGQNEMCDEFMSFLKKYPSKMISIEKPFGAANNHTYWLQGYGVGRIVGQIHEKYPKSTVQIISPPTVKSLVKPKDKKGQRYPKENVKIWFDIFVEVEISLPKSDKRLEAIRDSVGVGVCGFLKEQNRKFSYRLEDFK